MGDIQTDVRESWRKDLDELTESQKGRFVAIEIIDPDYGDAPEDR